jgi:D-glycero-D-manno-heptose 1,7-bisphosphate phosphatase
MPRRAVFLDRDGVINNHGDYVNSVAEFELIDGSAAAIRRLNEAGLPVYVITNQGGIAFGYLTEEELAEIHDLMHTLLAAEGAHVDGVYWCPYHPRGTVPPYNRESPDRKPGSGMFARAAADHDLDLAASYYVGDMTGDMLAGQRAGCRTILVATGFGGQDGDYEAEPELRAADLADAVDIILDERDLVSGA